MKRKQSVGKDSALGEKEIDWLAFMASSYLDEHDHRRSQRKPVDLDVSLNEWITCLGIGAVRDMSVHGAFVQVADERLHPGMVVQVGFPFLFAGMPIERRLAAQVVRVEPDGVALRFNKYNPEFYSDLISLLYAA